jgi:hypothetical protein
MAIERRITPKTFLRIPKPDGPRNLSIGAVSFKTR